METPLTSSGEPRSTKDINDKERELIRGSELPYRELARIFHITEDQVRYIRSSEGKQARRATKVWSESEEGILLDLYDAHGWKPRLIAQAIPTKTYSQVYRKMTREFKGR